MTNEQIIAEIAETIYGTDAVMMMLEKGMDIPLHTLKGWAERGPYRVRKGEHGIETRLWKKRKPSSDNDQSEDGGFYLAKAYLFRIDQVDRISYNVKTEED